MDVNTDCDCSSTTDPGKGLSSSLGLDITLAWMASKPSTLAHSSLPSPLQICLCPQDMNHCLFLPHPTIYLLTIIVPAWTDRSLAQLSWLVGFSLQLNLTLCWTDPPRGVSPRASKSSVVGSGSVQAWLLMLVNSVQAPGHSCL